MKDQTKTNTANNGLTVLLFIIYLVALYWILIMKLGVHFPYMQERRVSLTPFREHVILTGENIMNTIIFIPLGIYAGVLFKRWPVVTKLFFVFSASLLVEAIQYILRVGAFDVTDIITNTSGGIIGLIIFIILEKVFSNSIKAQRFINAIAAMGTVLMMVLLVLLKVNMLPIRYR